MPDRHGGLKISRLHLPARQPGTLERPRVTDMLTKVIDEQPTTLVVAPSGYGKTTAVAAWAAQQETPVAWTTLGRFDTDAHRVSAAVIRALRSLAVAHPGTALASFWNFDPADTSPQRVFDAVLAAVAEHPEPVHLVIDDAHLAGDHLAHGLVGALIDSDAPGLRVIVIGTSYTELALSRLAVTRPHAVVRARNLAFDTDEVTALAAANDSSMDPSILYDESRGWPIAVRLMTLAGVRSDPDAVADAALETYLRDHVLASVPADLAEFALATSVCDRMTPTVAAAVAGTGTADDLLERCAQTGMPIDRFQTDSGPVYQWHALFARACRRILATSNPEQFVRARLVAARAMESTLPLAAASLWLKADRPGEALRVLSTRWVGMVVGSDAQALDTFCTTIPAPWNDHPSILTIRACTHEVLNKPELAAMFFARAQARAEEDDDSWSTVEHDYSLVRDQAQLMLSDDRAELAAMSRTVRTRFERGEMSSQARAATLYLLGWTEMRLRLAPELAVDLLTSALAESTAAGDQILVQRSRSHLIYTLAWAGRLNEAHELIGRVSADEGELRWKFAGDGTAFGTGYLAYLRNDLPTARSAFERVVHAGAEDDFFGNGARCMLALTAAASGDPQACRRALVELRDTDDQTRHGLPWQLFRHVGMAALYEASGRRERAMQIVLAYQHTSDIPFVTVILSGIAARARRPRLAADMMHRLERYSSVSYVRAATLLADAQVALNNGLPQSAHDHVERALDVAAREDLRRLFAGDGVDLRQLLTDHLAWGTAHDGFIAACLASTSFDGPLTALSERELEVFAQLRTTRTMKEIASDLGVSLNTVKTHQRAIYRKLGVSSRREAVQQTK